MTSIFRLAVKLDKPEDLARADAELEECGRNIGRDSECGNLYL